MNKSILTFLLAFLLIPGVLYSQEVPEEYKKVAITEKIGQTLLTQATFEKETGQSISLSAFFDKKNPKILVFAYYNCPMLCNLVLTGVSDALKAIPQKINQDYEVITISIDPKDTPDSATAFKKKYISSFSNLSEAQKGWTFLTGKKQEIDKVADSVGFAYQYQPKTKEYAHGAMIAFISADGKICRYLYGVDFKPFDVKMALIETSDKKARSSVEKFLMLCYNYSPHQKGYTLYAMRLMQVSAFLTVVIILSVIFVLLKKYRK